MITTPESSPRQPPSRRSPASGTGTRQPLVDPQACLSRSIRSFISEASKVRDPCLILGETGTGKTHISRLIHESSERAQRPLVHVNCGEIPAELVERELFGHVRGSFTGAVRDSDGLFEAAHRSSLLLDEIGELPLALQPTLLRVCDTGVIRRVGDNSGRRVDVRLIAATNRNLPPMVRNGGFRADLYYRISVLVLEVPSLRERKNELPALINLMLRKRPETARIESPISSDGLEILMAHRWPGNIRELENVIVRLALACRGRTIDAKDVANALNRSSIVDQDLTAPRERYSPPASPEAERIQVRDALRAEGWHRGRAATRLGMSRTTLYHKIRSLGIVVE